MKLPAIEQLQTMLAMQDSMNSKVHPQWQAQDYEWYRAVWIECGELMDHVGYKWWKKQDTDWPQVQLEIVDIWHFGMSDWLARAEDTETVAGELLAAINSYTPKPQAATGQAQLHQATEALAQSSLQGQCFVVGDFIELMQAAELDFDALYIHYVGKNVLNFFRQDHGYKDGSYRKLWDGREDNEHLSEIVDALDSGSRDFADQVYQSLAQRYQAAAENSDNTVSA